MTARGRGTAHETPVREQAGRAGLRAADQAARAAPDGYNRFISTTAAWAILPSVKKNLPYDATNGFMPITRIATASGSCHLLLYVGVVGGMKRGLTVLKMRGSAHDKGIREFTIDKGGMRVGRPFRNVTGILAGTPMHVSPGDLGRIWSQADQDASTYKEHRRP